MFDVRCSMLDVGCWMLDVRCSFFKNKTLCVFASLRLCVFASLRETFPVRVNPCESACPVGATHRTGVQKNEKLII